MAQFVIGSPIETDTPIITVDSPTNAPIMPGMHRFQLVVRDNDGLLSQAAFVDIVIRDERGPTAVLTAPSEVPFGQSFELRGDRSSDPSPGRIVSYVWTMMT